MKSAGICVGAANISLVEMERNNGVVRVIDTLRLCHEGNVIGTLQQIRNRLRESGYENVGITGRKISNLADLSCLSEPEATELAFKFVNRDREVFDAIVSAGAELFSAYILDREGNILTIRTPGKCASGTGEFFLQQIRRMNLSLGEALRLVSADKIYRVSGRCSVFCKSDCTHGLNKGESAGSILAGLCEMMAKKILELLVNVPAEKVMLVGAVALNWRVVDFLKKHIPHIIVPEHAAYFEAIGGALFALEGQPHNHKGELLKHKSIFPGYATLANLNSAFSTVDLINTDLRSSAKAGDRCIVGLDVGSTTTKAVVLRVSDDKILGSVYLRTNGNPVEASRQCYRALAGQISSPLEVIGIGVTGSGRQISGLHAGTCGIVNEIIAHARAAAYFDKEVDTILEIGGQDSKFTYLVNGVPADYAMNEACSAGTGSFLEESCKETLGIAMEDISGCALEGKHPPNFNDQCAAFISSDIKTACYGGIQKNDIVAGLVYSICLNYLNRVKGNRTVGRKIFMQGGVCYNQAVPLAMSLLLEKRIVVPPEPGLMGAYGVALEIKEKVKNGLLKEDRFDLYELSGRSVKYHEPFRCPGAQEKCDRRCEISRIEVAGKIHPFGGACNKYYNLHFEIKFETKKLNLVSQRQEILFADYPKQSLCKETKTIGINRSFLTHMLFPLYHHFFTGLGLRVALSDTVLDEGVKKKGASFCYPAEIAHGLFQNLLTRDTDYIFLPHVLELKSKNAARVRKEEQSTCMILQAEPYYLKSVFKNIDKEKLISSVLNFSQGYAAARGDFVIIGQQLGYNKEKAAKAYAAACQAQEDFIKRMKQAGRGCLVELKNNPEEIAVVILGRAYNAFAAEANMAIPDKFASRGITVLPFDCLPYEEESDDTHMNWATGQMLLKAGRLIKKHPQLFACFITNFSCGPDSFIVEQVRDIMGKKPLLILEIDSHTADAGINTRIEAFLDVVQNWRHLKQPSESTSSFIPARCITYKKRLWVISSQRERMRLNDARVKVLIPPMGELGPQALAATFRNAGIKSVSLLPSEHLSLKYGRGNASCKECLPLILTAGGLIKYLKEQPQNAEVLIYFMPATGGNCRFGQYHVFLKNFIRKNRLKNISVWAIDTQNSYVGLGIKFNALALKAIVISDAMHDIKNALKVLARDRDEALRVFEQDWRKILHCIEKNPSLLERQLEECAVSLQHLPLKYPLKEAKCVALMGEIYVRRDDFCCETIIERLAQKGLVLKTAPVLEWMYYVDYLVKQGLIESNFGFSGRIEFIVKDFLQKKYERRIKEILVQSGLYQSEAIDIAEIVRYGRGLVSEHLTGESIVVVGAALREIMHSVCGIISIGPFACLPTRIIEAILSSNLNLKTKLALEGKNRVYDPDSLLLQLPFLSIETDGNPLPPIIEAKLEAFCLQAQRLHQRMAKTAHHPQ